MKPDSPKLVAVANPFLGFTYPAGANAALSAPFNRWPKTVRYPDAQGNSQPAFLLSALRAETYQMVYNAQRLFSLTTWDAFTFGSAGTTGLEGIHNTIHNKTGGSSGGQPGNMATIEAAAFDPIFYLHHAQVDRILDLWFRRHRVWTSDATDLLPFRNTGTSYWKFPEIYDSNSSFNYSYNGPMNMTTLASSDDAEVNEPISEVVTDLDNSNVDEATFMTSSLASESISLEWSVRIRCKVFELGGSFSVYFFLAKKVPPIPDEWLFHPTFAGTFDVFANAYPEQCVNRTEHADDYVKGFVHINKKFSDISRQISLNPSVVLPYLKGHLSWGVTKATSEVVDLKNFPSLEVTLLCMPLKYLLRGRSRERYPAEGYSTIYPDIIRGRAGGDLGGISD